MLAYWHVHLSVHVCSGNGWSFLNDPVRHPCCQRPRSTSALTSSGSLCIKWTRKPVGHTGRAKTQSHALLDNHFTRRLGCLALRLQQAQAVIKQVVILSLVPGKDKWLLCSALPPHSAPLCNAQPCLLSSEELSLETQSA